MCIIRRFATLAFWSLILSLSPLAGAATASLSVRLLWTTPGDDSLVGLATGYDLRYSVLPITGVNFTQATAVTGLFVPKVSGAPDTFTVTGLVAGTGYYFAIKTVDDVGNWSGISNVLFHQASTTGVDDPLLALSFSAPWPNPARQSMRCAYTLPQAAPIQVDAFDIAGRHVRTIASGWHEAGRGELVWDLRDGSGSSVAAGIYLVRAQLADRSWTRRLVVVR